MAVIINELEVVAETPAADAEPAQASAEPAATPPSDRLTPRDVLDLARHRAERDARVCTH